MFNWSLSAFGVIKDSGVEKLIGSDYSGFWNHYDEGQNDNNTAINAYLQTKAFDGESPNNFKTYYSVGLNYTNFGQYNIDIEAIYEFTANSYITTINLPSQGTGLGSFILDQDRLGDTEQLGMISEDIRGAGRYVQIKIGNSDADEPFRIYQIRINFRPGREELYR